MSGISSLTGILATETLSSLEHGSKGKLKKLEHTNLQLLKDAGNYVLLAWSQWQYSCCKASSINIKKHNTTQYKLFINLDKIIL